MAKGLRIVLFLSILSVQINYSANPIFNMQQIDYVHFKNQIKKNLSP